MSAMPVPFLARRRCFQRKILGNVYSTEECSLRNLYGFFTDPHLLLDAEKRALKLKLRLEQWAMILCTGKLLNHLCEDARADRRATLFSEAASWRAAWRPPAPGSEAPAP